MKGNPQLRGGLLIVHEQLGYTLALPAASLQSYGAPRMVFPLSYPLATK